MPLPCASVQTIGNERHLLERKRKSRYHHQHHRPTRRYEGKMKDKETPI